MLSPLLDDGRALLELSMALSIRGINYDTGTEFMRGESTRTVLRRDELECDLLAIRDDLHCTSINLYGTDLSRITEAAELALAMGLHVSIQLRAIDIGKDETLHRIARAAAEANRLAAATHTDRVMLNVGCELTLFTNGFLPGSSFLRRISHLAWSWPLLPVANSMLRRFMRRAKAACSVFAGPITYSAGTWERVDWSLFDFVGIDLYRDKDNESNYAGELRSYFVHGKPVLITEFGCCTFEGAQRLGGSGWMAIDWTRLPPETRPGHVRSEETQACVIAELLELYGDADVYGAYVFEFVQPQLPHSSDARFDLDMASYGIVKPLAHGDNVRWQRKAAFETVAAYYGKARK